jgi:catechol 2,3-dioxygenase-like lactoylglutathione lyase family enzyme
MKFTSIKETCLYVKDLEKAKHFYQEKLNLPIISYIPDKHIFFRAGNSVLLCFNPEDSKLKNSPPAHYAIGKQHFAFEVSEDDYFKTKSDIKQKGIAIIDEIIWGNGKESFYFNDFEGNVLEILPEGVWD